MALPDAPDAKENFNKFVHVLLQTWLDMLPESAVDEPSREPGVHKKALIEPIGMHLKELSASTLCNSGNMIVAYLTNQMQSHTGLLQTIRDIEEENRS